MDLNGKNILVTGASGGMGTILCRELAKRGAALAICSNKEEDLKKQAEDLKNEFGATVFARAVDITNEAEVASFFTDAAAQLGAFYGMANLAGLSIPGKISEMKVEDYDAVIDVNVKGTFLAAKYFAQNASNPAIIVNIGSAAAINANGNAPVYCTAKAAVNMLSRGMLLQLGSAGIRVTTVNPGGADTPFWGTRAVDRSKLMAPADVVEVILFALTSSPRIQIHEIFFESTAKFQ